MSSTPSTTTDDVSGTTTCPDYHVCRNGGTCVEDPIQEGSFYCDCSTAGVMEDTIFAGLSCEYEATVFCNKLDETNSNSFCTNGGKCKQMMEDEDDGVHYGCTCIDNYTGDFCEYIEGQNVPEDAGPYALPGTSGAETTAIAAIVVGLLIVVVMIVGCLVCRRRRLLFWSEHTMGPSKSADLELQVDGGVTRKETDETPEPGDLTVEALADGDESVDDGKRSLC